MNQQELVWVRLPFSNLERGKVRPAVVVSNDKYNRANQDVIVCAITSKAEKRPYGVLIDNENLSTGKLPIKSLVRADKIMPVEKALIIRQFAKLDNRTFDTVIKEISRIVQR